MAFADDEVSVQLSEPRIGVKITHGVTVYRMTNSVKDTIFYGEVYTATSLKIGETPAIPTSASPSEITVSIPADHPLVRRYSAGGVPPKSILVEFYRLQMNSGQAEIFWIGKILSSSVKDKVASFAISSTMSQALDRSVATYTAGRNCPYRLYDETTCTIDRTLWKLTKTVLSVDGRIVRVDPILPDHWASYGELVHEASGESMTIFEQYGGELTLQFKIWELQAGDIVSVYAGCSHEINECSTKFANQLHYGGQPQLKRNNPHRANGFGVYTSED
jgi:hypothetical protein